MTLSSQERCSADPAPCRQELSSATIPPPATRGPLPKNQEIRHNDVSCKTQLMRLSARLIRHLMGLFEGAPQLSLRDTLDRGPMVSAPLQLPSSQTYDPSILYLFCFYLLIKPGSKFSTIVREYVMEPSTLSKSRAELK
ncbi:hypothetical protein Tco_0436241 [Tanacetum coccineum]